MQDQKQIEEDWVQLAVQAILVSTQNVQPLEVDEILLENIYIPRIDDKIKYSLEQYKNLKSLAFNFCELETLVNMPDLPNLIRLELAGNKFRQTDLFALHKYQNLKGLVLRSNILTNIEPFKDMSKAKLKLLQLDVCDSEFAKIHNHQQQLRQLMPTLEYIDNLRHDQNQTIIEPDKIVISELQDLSGIGQSEVERQSSMK